MQDPEYFGDNRYVSIQSRLRDAWSELGRNPLFNNAGRLLGIDDPRPLGADETASLVHRFSVVGMLFDDEADMLPFKQELEANDIHVSVYDIFASGPGTPRRVVDLLRETPLPNDLTWVRVDAESPAADVRAFQQLASACGVAPPPGYIIRGELYGADCYLIRDAAGEAVATGAVNDRHQPGGLRPNWATSGIVAVHPEQRGRGLGTLVYAKALAGLFARRPTAMAYTGVKPDNLASRRTCESVGLELLPGQRLCVVTSNRTFGTGSFTR